MTQACRFYPDTQSTLELRHLGPNGLILTVYSCALYGMTHKRTKRPLCVGELFLPSSTRPTDVHCTFSLLFQSVSAGPSLPPSLPLTRQPHPLISRVIFSPASPSDCSSPTDNPLLSVSHPWNVLYLVICHNLTPSPHRFCLPCFLVPPFLSLIPSTLDLLTPSLKMNVCVCHVSLENAAGDER